MIGAALRRLPTLVLCILVLASMLNCKTTRDEAEVKLITLPASADRGSDFYSFQPGRSYRDTRTRFESEFEKRYVKWLLGRHAGNISAAAREAQMDRKYLYDLAKKHGMRGKEDDGNEG